MKKFVLVAAFALIITSGVYGMDMGPVPAKIADCKKAPSEITGEVRKFSFISTGKTEAAFTDIGCALVYRKTLCASESVDFDENAVVHDYNTGEAIAFETSFYVADSGVETPAGYGIIAFKDKASAEKFTAAGKGGILKFYDLTIMEIK